MKTTHRRQVVVPMQYNDFLHSLQYQESQYRLYGLVAEIALRSRSVRFRSLSRGEKPHGLPQVSMTYLRQRDQFEQVSHDLPIVVVYRNEIIGILEQANA